jgi:hypothetical protein
MNRVLSAVEQPYIEELKLLMRGTLKSKSISRGELRRAYNTLSVLDRGYEENVIERPLAITNFETTQPLQQIND